MAKNSSTDLESSPDVDMESILGNDQELPLQPSSDHHGSRTISRHKQVFHALIKINCVKFRYQ